MLTIQLDGRLEERLKRAAESAGSEPQAVARRLLDEHLPTTGDTKLASLDDQYQRGYEQIPEEATDAEALLPHLPGLAERWE